MIEQSTEILDHDRRWAAQMRRGWLSSRIGEPLVEVLEHISYIYRDERVETYMYCTGLYCAGGPTKLHTSRE